MESKAMKVVMLAALAALVLGGCNTTQERIGGAAVGAAVGGPIGAGVGVIAGPAVSDTVEDAVD
jgi:hypothetical protein